MLPRLSAAGNWIIRCALSTCCVVLLAVMPENQPAASSAALRADSQSTCAGPVARVVQSLQSGYENSRWDLVRRQFRDGSLASILVDRLRRLRAETVLNARWSTVYIAQLSSHTCVGTLELAADIRAPADYYIFSFSLSGKSAKVVGQVTGLRPPHAVKPVWKVTKTAHFIIYHSPYQLVGKDKWLVQALEQQRSDLIREFKVRVVPRAIIYVYPTVSTMSQLSHGACGSKHGELGCTLPLNDPPLVLTTVRALFHEPIHVYELSMAPPVRPHRPVYVAPLFISEGTAVALEDSKADPHFSDYCSDLDFAPLDACARIAIRHVQLRSLVSNSGFRSLPSDFAYSLGGSFVSYLIHSHGYESFKVFYYRLAAQPKDRLSDYDVASRSVYKTDTMSLLTAWRATLCAGGC